MYKFIKCVNCYYFNLSKNKVGYCKIFGNLPQARDCERYCGPWGSFYLPKNGYPLILETLPNLAKFNLKK